VCGKKKQHIPELHSQPTGQTSGLDEALQPNSSIASHDTILNQQRPQSVKGQQAPALHSNTVDETLGLDEALRPNSSMASKNTTGSEQESTRDKEQAAPVGKSTPASGVLSSRQKPQFKGTPRLKDVLVTQDKSSSQKKQASSILESSTIKKTRVEGPTTHSYGTVDNSEGSYSSSGGTQKRASERYPPGRLAKPNRPIQDFVFYNDMADGDYNEEELDAGEEELSTDAGHDCLEDESGYTTGDGDEAGYGQADSDILEDSPRGRSEEFDKGRTPPIRSVSNLKMPFLQATNEP